ncbi:GNAT family N-acetyltransferase [Paenibacillus hodogayensis]|uniref:GNAT family N-acetyltransferase n=1 Tax=Paenibacillus hodogayensis TaxID=279208 RepID=A0ABV5VY07_9BACL
MDIQIRACSAVDWDAAARIDDRFIVDSVLVLTLEEGRIGYTVRQTDRREKSYPHEPFSGDADVADEEGSGGLADADRTAYVAWAGERPVGRIMLKRSWNGYACVEDIAVDRKYRRYGIGRRLIEQAKQWAGAGGMPGIMLETQNNNVEACRFYESCGFVIGGFDRHLYRGFPDLRDEVAIFWYWLPDRE